MGYLSGFIGGTAKAVGEIADKRITRYTAEMVAMEREAAEMAKEKRIAAYAETVYQRNRKDVLADEARGDTRRTAERSLIRAEGVTAAATKRALETSPEYIKQQIAADALLGQGVIDTKIAQAPAVAAAGEATWKAEENNRAAVLLEKVNNFKAESKLKTEDTIAKGADKPYLAALSAIEKAGRAPDKTDYKGRDLDNAIKQMTVDNAKEVAALKVEFKTATPERKQQISDNISVLTGKDNDKFLPVPLKDDMGNVTGYKIFDTKKGVWVGEAAGGSSGVKYDAQGNAYVKGPDGRPVLQSSVNAVQNEAPKAQVAGRPHYYTPVAELRRLQSKPRGVSQNEANEASDELALIGEARFIARPR